MAFQVPQPPRIGNFKPVGVEKKKQGNSKFREERKGMSEDHCKLIRQLPCTTCNRMPAGTVHHLKQNTGERGMGVRSTDKHGLPQCIFCHDEIENAGTKNETSWYLERGIDPIELAEALWKNTGDLARMTGIVIAHKSGVKS